MTELSNKTTRGLVQHFASKARGTQPKTAAAQYRCAALLALDRADEDSSEVAAIFAQLAISAAIEEAGNAHDG
jgi:hypothetical protein